MPGGRGGQEEFCYLNVITEPEKAFHASYGNRTGETSPEAPKAQGAMVEFANATSHPNPGLEKTDLQEDDGTCPDKFPCSTGKAIPQGLTSRASLAQDQG